MVLFAEEIEQEAQQEAQQEQEAQQDSQQEASRSNSDIAKLERLMELRLIYGRSPNKKTSTASVQPEMPFGLSNLNLHEFGHVAADEDFVEQPSTHAAPPAPALSSTFFCNILGCSNRLGCRNIGWAPTG